MAWKEHLASVDAEGEAKMSHLFSGRTYDWDLSLFRDLGLKAFVDIETQDEFEVGTVRTEEGEVRVRVSCMPAQFWVFDVLPDPEHSDARPIRLSTGSGSLSDYWPTVVLFLKGMMVATFPVEFIGGRNADEK